VVPQLAGALVVSATVATQAIRRSRRVAASDPLLGDVMFWLFPVIKDAR
jgi:hypothetical protein